MTLQDFKNYLRGLAGAGIAQPQLDGMVATASEVAYAKVWGAYPWSVRRGTGTITTVASQGYNALPADFESIVSIKYDATSGYVIDLQEEVAFDTNFPHPSGRTGVPMAAKVAYQGPAAADKFRLIWYPTPDAVYSLPLVYNRRADIANLPNLPASMLDAILQYGAMMMMPTVEARITHRQMAQAALSEAITADAPITGISPQFGANPGWDDFSLNQSAGSEWPSIG